jgi:uncharacterized SAM-binding protein YcdF (DUF218 family)
MRLPDRFFRALLPALLALFALFGLVVAIDVYLYSQRTAENPADAAIVLGAAVWREQPSPVFRERINHAINLYHSGQVRMIIFTGGIGERDDVAESEVARQYAMARGVPAEAILIETRSTSTYQNLAYAREVAAQYNLHTFLIVSTPYHMRRAIALAHDLNMDAAPSPTRTIRWLSWYTHTRAYVREVVGYMAYLLMPIRET